METNKSLKLLSEGTMFFDVSGSEYKIIDTKPVGDYFRYYIEVVTDKKGEHQVINGPSPPMLKHEWYSYSIHEGGNIYSFAHQYMQNIIARGYIGYMKDGEIQLFK